MIRLYGHPASANTHRVRLTLAALHTPYEEVTVDLLAGAQRAPAFLQLNPLGAVPVIDDEGVVLRDSQAICVYLAASRSDRDTARIWSDDPVDQARILQWLFFTANDLHNGVGLARNHFAFGIPLDAEAALARGEAALTALEEQLWENSWLAASRPTLADISCYPFVAVAAEARLDIEGRPALQNWLQRLAAEPWFKPMPTLAALRAAAAG